MIDSIEIINFQSHRYTALEFLPGVNVIKGTSHQGKSSVMRAIRWALFNKPRGDNFKSHFAKDNDSVSVGVGFTDDHWMLRLRGKENNYLAGKEDNYLGDEFSIEMAAIRSDVPDEIQKITQISDINYQPQGEAYFLLNKTAGQAGKQLNELVGLQIIDESRTKINSMIRDTKSHIELVKMEMDQATQQLKDFKHLDEAARLVKETHQAQNKLDIASERATTINDIVYDINKHKLGVKDTKEWLEVKDGYEDLTKQLETLSEVNSRFELLTDIYSDVRSYKKKINNTNQELIRDNKRYKELEKQLNFCQYCGADRKYWNK